MSSELALKDVRIGEPVGSLETGKSGVPGLGEESLVEAKKIVRQIEKLIERGLGDHAIWEEIGRRIDLKTEMKRLVDLQETVTAEQLMILVTQLMKIITHELPPGVLFSVQESQSASLEGAFQGSKQALIEDFERRYLALMLSRTKGNVTEAACFAGLSRTAFHRLMSKYGMSSSDFKDHQADA
ncbi:hypothetical protein MYX82_01995 [Acidobacteria bacterium AH-259-D05]|nr:hypothetical protein [Acidobacteria bacterium AH-259-D05]